VTWGKEIVGNKGSFLLSSPGYTNHSTDVSPTPTQPLHANATPPPTQAIPGATYGQTQNATRLRMYSCTFMHVQRQADAHTSVWQYWALNLWLCAC
jgi:hypothetical protein